MSAIMDVISKKPLETILDSDGLDVALQRLAYLDDRYQKAIALLGCSFAQSVLPLFEAKHPNEKRPRTALKTKRSWIRGQVTTKGLEIAVNAICAINEPYEDGAAYTAQRAAEPYENQKENGETVYHTSRLALDAAKDAMFCVLTDSFSDEDYFVKFRSQMEAAADAEQKKQIKEFRQFCRREGRYAPP